MFTLPDSSKVVYLEGHYSMPVVALSIIIACISSYTAISINERIRYNSFFHRYVWLTLASFSMGFGIWSMHFIGMSALMLPTSMQYHLGLTVLSVLPAMLASFLAFYMTSSGNRSVTTIVISGIFMGLGISSMHYLGMMAMIMEDVEYTYRINYFILSVLIAIIVSFVSLFIFARLNRFMNNLILKLTTSTIMGLAVASMHYTGMHAVRYYVDADIQLNSIMMHEMNIGFLILAVAAGTFVVLFISGLSALLDRYVDYRLNYFDSLTRLPNRRQFEKIIHTPGNLNGLAILHIHDLEKWNNTYGFEFGDAIIRYIEQITVKLKPKTVAVYRIDGNRLGFISTSKDDNKKIEEMAEQISAILSSAININDRMIIVQTVFAISFVDKKRDETQAFENALSVLNHHSVKYEHEVIIYDPAIHVQSFQTTLIADVEEAMSSNQFYLVYQPKVEMKSNKITGLEALLRWDHPTYGFLSPAVFIPILESADKMFDVTDWVIDRVCSQIAEWEKSGTRKSVSVNIPGPYVTSPRLMSYLEDRVNKYGFNPELLELEMTETSAVENIEGAIQAVHAFRNYGFSVALDDFGTGVSSLSYLKRLPVSTLKIDKSFVDGVPDSQKDSEIMKAIIALGNSLHLNIVIEGVETEQQVTYLSNVDGCKVLQGYYYAKPMVKSELEDWCNNFIAKTAI